MDAEKYFLLRFLHFVKFGTSNRMGNVQMVRTVSP